MKATISHKNCWGSLNFHEKVLKNVRLAQRYPEVSSPNWLDVVPKTMAGSGAQEWPSQLATNIEQGGKGCKSHYFTVFVTDCRHFSGKLRWY